MMPRMKNIVLIVSYLLIIQSIISYKILEVIAFAEKMFEMPVISNENRGQGIHIRCGICKKLKESSY